MFSRQKILQMLVVLSFISSSAQAVVITTVNELAPVTDAATDTWVVGSATQNGGTAEIVSLNGLGGNLESGAALPDGAAKLTTGMNNADRAEIGLYGDFGTVADIFNSDFSLSFDYYRQNEVGGNVFAAPSIKLTFYNSICSTGDCYFQAIFEPYLNGGVVNELWTTVNIDLNSGGFWQTGGFGLVNDGGGCTPPCKTLQQIGATANSDFQGASLLGIAIGMGTYNQGMTGYVDDVNLKIGQFEARYDFELKQVSEPSAIITFALGLGVMWYRRRTGK